MILTIFLWSFALVVASANNVIPGHTFPAYQLNGYMNPVVNQPSNNNPYTQEYTTQNQLQQLNISPAAIKQALLTTLLESANVQPNINPSTVGYNPNWNGAGYNQIPVKPVNNVPVEYFNSYSNNADAERKSNENGGESRQRRKKSKSRQKQNNTDVREESSDKDIPVKGDDANCTDNSAKNNKTSRKKSRKQKQDAEQVTESESVENQNKNVTRRRKKKKKEITVEETTTNPTDNEYQVESPTPRRRRQKKKKDSENKEADLETNTNKQPKEIQENGDLDITNEGANNENRRTRNSKPETKKGLKTAPSNPKEMTNNFISNINQLKNPSMTNWFENVYQSMSKNVPTNTEKTIIKRKPKRPNRNNRKNKVQKKKPTAKPPIVNSTTTTIATPTTEKVIIERTQVNFNSNPTKENIKSLELDEMNRKYSSNEIFQDGNSLNDFENHYEGYIDEYYPSFYDSAAYNANNKEIIIKNLNDNKYFYTTDSTETKKLQKYSEVTERIQDIFDKNKHTYHEIEKESIRNAYKKDFDDKIEEQLQFRSPPHLVSPDFRTRQVDKSGIKPVYYTFNDYDKYEDKSSCYSNAKIPYNSAKCKNITPPKDIETVYAKSKVASYGPVYKPDEDSSAEASNAGPWVSYGGSEHWTYPDAINESFKAGDTTYVVAKSLDW